MTLYIYHYVNQDVAKIAQPILTIILIKNIHLSVGQTFEVSVKKRLGASAPKQIHGIKLAGKYDT